MSPTPTPPNPLNSSDNKVNNEEVDSIIQNELGDVNTNEYQILSQQQQNDANLRHNEDDSDESNDNDEEDDDDFDPDLDFEQLATTRAYISQQSGLKTSKLSTQMESNHNLFEVDFFERKIKLECEDIVLDENKTKKITEIMANFKLDDKFVPNWAKLVPENVWKQNLIDSLNAKKTDLFDNK